MFNVSPRFCGSIAAMAAYFEFFPDYIVVKTIFNEFVYRKDHVYKVSFKSDNF